MALQVWLPLNGDLHNQGLSNIIFTDTGVNIDNNGKIGKCYHFNADQYIKESTYDWTNFNTSEFSLCCWYKEPSPVASGNSQMICIGTSSGWNNIRIGLLRRSSNGYPMFSVSDGSTAVNYNFTASTFTLDTWNHIAVTYNNGELKMYLNGVLNKTSSTTIVPILNNSQHLGIGAASNGAEKLTGYLNDVRIYDHALSAKEVEEISKGLVLHYKLDKNINILDNCYSNPTFNTSANNGGWSHWGRSGSLGTYGQNTDKQYIFRKNNIYSHWWANDASATGEYLLYQSPAFDGGVRSLQCIIKEENSLKINESIVFPAWNARSGGVPIDYWTDIESLGNGFYLCKCEGIQQDGSNNLVGFYVKPGYKVYISEAYLENNKSICSDIFFYFYIIEDSSGYQHNGEIFTPLIPFSETPRYICSTYFNGETSAIKVPYTDIASTDDIFTLNLWFKKDDLGSKNYETLFGGPSGFEMDTRAGSATALTLYMASTRGTIFTQFNFGEWYMITMVNNGTNELYYVNAELKKTIDKKPMPAGNYYIGAWSTETRQNYKGLISDFRIYKTALTEKQIKELYDTSATVDKNGNIYTREAIEL